MAMNPRLLRPRQGGDPDALRYIAAVQAADGQSLEAGVRKAIDDFVVGCKADGIWSAIKASCILMGARTLSGALTPLVGTAPENNNFVSGDYDRKTGLAGDGAMKALNSNRNVNADPQDSSHMAVYASSAGASTTRAYIGSGAGAVGTTLIRTALPSINLAYQSRFNSAIGTTAVGYNVAGFIGMSRGASDRYFYRSTAGESEFLFESQTPFDGDAFVFARLSGVTGTVGQFSDARLAFYSIGEALSLSALDARISALYSSIGAAIP